jgi:hypothetical protein
MTTRWSDRLHRVFDVEGAAIESGVLHPTDISLRVGTDGKGHFRNRASVATRAYAHYMFIAPRANSDGHSKTERLRGLEFDDRLELDQLLVRWLTSIDSIKDSFDTRRGKTGNETSRMSGRFGLA